MKLIGGGAMKLIRGVDDIDIGCLWPSSCTACALRAYCTRQRPVYSLKNTCHLTGCTAKQQNPHETDETAFNLVLHCPYEQTT